MMVVENHYMFHILMFDLVKLVSFFEIGNLYFSHCDVSVVYNVKDRLH